MKYKFEAIIWDCDGVLIDSEVLAAQTSVDLLKSYGVKINCEDYINRFIGGRRDEIITSLEVESGIPLSKLITEEVLINRKTTILQNFKKYLNSIKNIEIVLNSLQLPMAVASGSCKERLDYSLDLVNLKPFFKDNIFSSDLVKHGKPKPDIFLYAAKKLKVNPKKCLVIEDSINGIRAAKAANMTVYAFTQGSHMSKNLKQKIQETKPDLIFDDMMKLLDLVAI
ncbi:HAD family hydrolase [Pseudomonadota bacterium]